MAEIRGFRYQTGEVEEIIKQLEQEGNAQADIDSLSELELYISELAEWDCVLDENRLPDDRVLSPDEFPEFYARYYFILDDKSVSIDFFLIGEADDDYDEIFWG